MRFMGYAIYAKFPLIALASFFLQSFPNHFGNCGDVTYLERPVIFGQIANPVTNEKTDRKKNRIENQQSCMTETEWNAIFMVIGSLLAVAGGAWQSNRQRRRDAKDSLLEILDDYMRIVEQTSDAKVQYESTLNSFIIPIKRAKSALWRKSKREQLGTAWREYKELKNHPEQMTTKIITQFWEKFYHIAS
jgi:hypothetical protein